MVSTDPTSTTEGTLIADEPQDDVSDPTMSRNPYYASAYFSPYYFYGGSTRTSTTVPAQPTGRDAVCYGNLVDRLESIGSFDSVIFGDPTRRPGAGAEAHPLAIVIPKGWEETDDTDPLLWVRRVSFTIRIVIRVEDDVEPFDRLDQLAAAVQVEVDQANLGGQSLPAMTKIRAGRYGTANQYPEWSVDLDGEFAELINPSAGVLVY